MNITANLDASMNRRTAGTFANTGPVRGHHDAALLRGFDFERPE